MSKQEFHKIWIEQCKSTEGIRERFGLEDAIRYLIGEKFLNFLEASNQRPEFADELPNFIAEVKRIFETHEISDFLNRILHESSVEQDEDWPFDTLEEAEVEPRDVIGEAEKIHLIERSKELLLA